MTLLASTNTGGAPPPGDGRSVVERFEQVAAAHPDRPALVCDGTVLTFGDLAARSGALAGGLNDRGVGAESLVGLLLPRGVDLVVGLLGVLRSGAGYVPMDSALPVDRVRYICADTAAAVVLAAPGDQYPVPVELAGRTLTVDACARAAGPLRRTGIHAGQRAYAMYTSGSTGQPKAVQVTHGSLTALLDGLATVVGPGPGPARIGWNASPSFDASVQQWLRLCRGDTIVLLGDRVRNDPAALADFIVEEHLDELDITPSHLVSLLELFPAGRRSSPLRLLIGGEEIAPGLWQRLAHLRESGAVVPVNLYGPTECTVDATYAQIDRTGGPHLGVPLPGVQAHLLDNALRPAGPGVEAEIYLAGSGVSRGYLGQPGLTAQRFVADPIGADGTRMYRTGDRARIGPDGRLEFLGRRDHQVKLRGFRIELGEIEAVLSRCPGVAQAVAMVRDDRPGGAGLVVYCRVEEASSGGFDAEAVRRAAAEQLPGYMVPNVLVPLRRFPLTPNGKVDRSALPPPGPAPNTGRHDRIAPRTPTEHLVAAAWCTVLEVDQVGIEDDFFELGGQSLLGIRLVAHLRRQSGRAIPLVAVFKYPVLRQLAAFLDEQRPGGPGR